MKTKNIFLLTLLSITLSLNSFAQFEPYTESAKMLTAGVGFSGWGIPLFVRYEHPVKENITVGGGLSYQSTSETFGTEKWKHSIFGVIARGSYHFNTLLKANDSWDFYAGLGLGYYFWDTSFDGISGLDYSGSGSGGFSLGLHVGGRYFFNDNFSINLELGGGTVQGGGTLGATFML